MLPFEPDAANGWTGSRFRYTGQIMLPQAQLYHYKARVYDPRLGRFLQTDPVGYEDGWNLYAYVHNDPLNAIDPSGEQTVAEPLLDFVTGVVHGTGQTAFAGGSADAVIVTGATYAGGLYMQATDPTGYAVGGYFNSGPAAGNSVAIQAEVGMLFGDRSGLTGVSAEGSGGFGLVSGTLGQTLAPDGGDKYASVAIGPTFGLTPAGPEPVSGRVATPVGISGDFGRMQLSPTAQQWSGITQAVIGFFDPAQKDFELKQ